MFVGGYISAYRRHNDNIVVYRLVGGRDFHVAGGHNKGVFAFGGYCYIHLRLAVHYSQLVELVSLVGRNGQRYGLAVFSRLFVGGYGAVLGRRDGNRAGYIQCAVAGYRIELRPCVRVVVFQRHDGVLELAHYGLVRCVRPTGGVGADSHLLKVIVGVCRTAADRIRVYAHTFGAVPLHNDAVAVALCGGECEVRHYVEYCSVLRLFVAAVSRAEYQRERVLPPLLGCPRTNRTLAEFCLGSQNLYGILVVRNICQHRRLLPPCLILADAELCCPRFCPTCGPWDWHTLQTALQCD